MLISGKSTRVLYTRTNTGKLVREALPVNCVSSECVPNGIGPFLDAAPAMSLNHLHRRRNDYNLLV
jgi:hypothetical protein